MALEDLTGNKYIDDLVATNPVQSTDDPTEGAPHIFGIKNVLQKQFGLMSANDYIKLSGTNIITLGTDGTEALRVDANQNIGIDVTPKAWGSAYRAIQIHDTSVIVATSGGLHLGENFYHDGTNYRRTASSQTSRYLQFDGKHVFYVSETGSADTIITWTTALTLDNNNNVAVGDAAIATNATDGFLYIPTCAGNPTGTPTAKTGLIPIIFDSTNNKIFVYDGGWLETAALT